MSAVRELPATAALLQNREAPESHRVDACHALGRSADPAAIAVLIEALDERSFSVRYAACEALILHGQAGVIQLLHELERNTDPRLYESAQHVFRRLPGPALRAAVQPVLDALDHATSATYVPIVASQTLRVLQKR